MVISAIKISPWGEERIRITELLEWQRTLGEMTLGPENYRTFSEATLTDIDVQVSRPFDFSGVSKMRATSSRRTLKRWQEVLSPLARKLHFPTIEVAPLGRGERELVRAETDTTLDALLLSVHLDHIRGSKYAVCAREDCRKIFPLESSHLRKYCEPYCGHIESVRRKRAQRRQPKALLTKT